MLRVLNINIEALFNKNKRFLTFILIVTCYYYLFGVCLNHSDGFKYSWVRRLLLEHIEDVCLGLVNVDLPSLGGVSKGFSLSGSGLEHIANFLGGIQYMTCKQRSKTTILKIIQVHLSKMYKI